MYKTGDRTDIIIECECEGVQASETKFCSECGKKGIRRESKVQGIVCFDESDMLVLVPVGELKKLLEGKKVKFERLYQPCGG